MQQHNDILYITAFLFHAQSQISAVLPKVGASCRSEMHLVFECTALQDLRMSFAPLFQRATTMQQFMWQPDFNASGSVSGCKCENNAGC